jgi:hypothetical protein
MIEVVGWKSVVTWARSDHVQSSHGAHQVASYRLPIADTFDCSRRVGYISLLTNIGVDVQFGYYPKRPSPSAQF